VKVGFGLEEDLQRLSTVRDVVASEVDIRLDANRAWSDEEALSCLCRMRSYGVGVVEDPLRGSGPELVERLHWLREESGYGVIVDETLRTVDEAERLFVGRAADVFSIRVSKNAGLIPSARVAALARSHGIALQPGCQVGETAILSAAAMRLAFSVGPIRYLENSNESLNFDRAHFVTRQDLTYGRDTAPRSQPGLGLGVDVLEDRLERFAVQPKVVGV
jgi:muconate cycloisomerase